MDETEMMARILAVRESVAEAARSAGRDPASVSILPVTKGFPAGVLQTVAAAGFHAVGENRVDETASKKAVLGELGMSVHMIGHLQRNKAGRAVTLFDRIDSVDSLRLANRLDALVSDSGRDALDILVQVNASGEASKGGFPVEDAPQAVETISRLPHLAVRGLMTMAPLGAGERTLHETFGRTRECLEICRRRLAGFEGSELSMGMSDDFAIAVAEGATQVRLGTALLGERRKWN